MGWVEWDLTTRAVSYTSFFTIEMGKTWVLPSFKQILIDSCQEFMNVTDKAKDKPRTALVTRVADQIRQAVNGTDATLPEDLEKVHHFSRKPAGDSLISLGYPDMVRK